MSNEITKANSNLPATQGQHDGTEEILRSDVIIPQVLLMQGLSEFVTSRKARIGDIVRSTTIEVLGTPEKPVNFIPITYFNEWRVEEKINGKFEFRGREKRDSKNEDLPYDFSKNGAEWRRIKQITVFSLLPDDIKAFECEKNKALETGEAPDLDKVLMPVAITFRSTSYSAGKAVTTHFSRARMVGANPCAYMLPLSCYEDKNDKGTYFVFKIGSSAKAPKEWVAQADSWRDILATQPVAIDESVEIGAPVNAAATAAPPPF